MASGQDLKIGVSELLEGKVGSLLPSISSQLQSRSPVSLQPLAAFPLLHFPSGHLVPHTHGALGIIVIPCILSLAFLLFSMFP